MGNLLIDIATGWYNFKIGSPFTQHLMSKRLMICDKCPHKKQLNSIGQAIVKTVNEEGSTFKCGLCNCPLSAMTAVPNRRCRDGRWPAAGDETYY